MCSLPQIKSPSNTIYPPFILPPPLFFILNESFNFGQLIGLDLRFLSSKTDMFTKWHRGCLQSQQDFSRLDHILGVYLKYSIKII